MKVGIITHSSLPHRTRDALVNIGRIEDTFKSLRGKRATAYIENEKIKGKVIGFQKGQLRVRFEKRIETDWLGKRVIIGN